MNKKFLALVLVSIFFTLSALIAVVSNDAETAFGDVTVPDATLSTSTPFLANNTVLCAGPGVLDGIYNAGIRTGQFWAINASSTTHTDFATTTALLAILDSGTGTTTAMIDYGVEANRGLTVSYTGTGTTTITYRCNG